MGTPKILQRVSKCGECPHYVYYSGGTHKCSETDEIVHNEDEIAPFCPLTDYPSRTIAEMETTITALRTPYKHGVELALLSHIATKLKTKLNARGSSILIQLKDGKAVGFDLNYINSISINPFELRFTYREETYLFLPDADPPKLYRKQQATEDFGELWHELKIACNSGVGQ